MLKLLVGVVIEVCVAVALAGVILAVAVPLLNGKNLVDTGGLTARIVVIGVLAVAVAVALCRPGSALHRYGKR